MQCLSSGHLSRLAFALLLALSVSACSPRLSNEELLARAEQSLAEGKLRAALLDARSVLQEDGRNARARYLMGAVYFRQRKFDEAAIELRKSMDLAPAPEAAVLYARSLVDGGQATELLEQHAQGQFEDVAREAQFLAVLARAQAVTGDPFSAEQTYAEAAAIAPEDPQVLMVLAILQSEYYREVDKALATLRRLLESHPDFDDGWMMYGRLQQQLHELPEAEKAFAEAAQLNPFRLEARLGLVAVQIDQGKFDAAAIELAALEKLIPQHPHVNYGQAMVAMNDEDYSLALEELAEVFNQAPRHLPSVYLAALANYRLGDAEAAEAYLDRFLAARPRNIAARQMVASVYIEQGEPEKAEQSVRELVEALPGDIESRRLLALSLLLQGKVAEGAAVRAEVVELAPESSEAYMDWGSALALQGDYEGAVRELARALALDPDNVEARRRLVLAHAANGDRSSARAELELLGEMAPDNPAYNQTAARLAISEGNIDRARGEFSRALELDPTSRVAWEGLASLAMQDDDSEAAMAILNGVLNVQPENTRALLRLAAVQRHRGEFEQSARTLQRAIDAQPRALAPRLLLARHWFDNGQPDRAVPLLVEIRDDYPEEPELFQLLTASFLALEQADAAANAAERLLRLLPESPTALSVAAQTAYFSGKYAVAESRLRKAVELDPDNPDMRSQLLFVLIRQNKLREADAEIASLPEGMVDDARLLGARGQLAFAMGNYRDAERYLRSAYDHAPGSLYVLRLSGAIWAQNRFDEAVGLLLAWIEDHPDDLQVLDRLAGHYLAMGKEKDAVATYEAMLRLQPDDPVVLNNLAWSLREMDSSRALEYVELALQGRPESASMLDTKAMIIMEQGAYTRALQVNQEALDRSRGHPKVRLHRAQIMERGGMTDQAIAILQELVVPSVQFPEKDQAQALLLRLSKRG